MQLERFNAQIYPYAQPYFKSFASINLLFGYNKAD